MLLLRAIGAMDSAQDPDDKENLATPQPDQPVSSPSILVVKEVMPDVASPATNDDLILYFNKKMPQWMAQAKAGLLPEVFIEIAERTIGIFVSESEFIDQTNRIAIETSRKRLHGDTKEAMFNWIYFQLNPPRELLDMQSNVEDLKLQRLTTEQLRCLLNLAVEMKLTKTQFYQQAVELFPNVTPGYLKVDLLLNKCSM